MIIAIIQYVYYTLFFLAPLAMTSITSELFEFNKMLLIYSSTLTIIFLWALIMILQKKIVFKRTILDIPILLFFVSQLISSIVSIDRHTSFFGYYGRFNGGLLSIICYILLYYGLVTFFDTKKLKKLLKISLISSFIVILWGLPGRLGYDLSCFLFAGQLNNNCWTDQFRPAERMFSTLGQPNWLGAYLSIHFFIALYFFLKENESKWNILTFFYLVLNFISILFTRSRSSLFATFAGLCSIFLLMIIFDRERIRNFVKSKLFLGLLGLLVLSVFIFKTGIPTVDRYLEFYKKTDKPAYVAKEPLVGSGVSESFDIRKIVWKGALDLGLKYPLFGSGVETFAYSYYFVRPKAHNLTSEWDFLYNKAHNEYLNYLGTTGFIGLGSYLIMLVGTYVLLLRKKNNFFNFILVGAYSSILVSNFFGFSTTTINLFMFVIPAFAIVMSRSDDETPKKHEKIYITTQQGVFITAFSILFIILQIYLGSYFYADTQYASADSESKRGNYQVAGVFADRAIKLKYEHVYLDKFSSILANLAVQASYQKKAEASQQLVTAAEKYNLQSLDDSSKNILYWKTRAKNQYLFYQITLNPRYIDQAIKAINYARELAPTDAKLPYNAAIFYSLLYDEAKNKSEKDQNMNISLSTVDEAIALKPNYRDAYYIKGQLLRRYGDKEGAKAAFKYIIERIDPGDSETLKELQ